MHDSHHSDHMRPTSSNRVASAITRAYGRLRADERGMTTAEYAVGTVAVAGLGGLLIKLLSSDEMRNLLWTIISGVLSKFI